MERMVLTIGIILVATEAASQVRLKLIGHSDYHASTTVATEAASQVRLKLCAAWGVYSLTLVATEAASQVRLKHIGIMGTLILSTLGRNRSGIAGAIETDCLDMPSMTRVMVATEAASQVRLKHTIDNPRFLRNAESQQKRHRRCD